MEDAKLLSSELSCSGLQGRCRTRAFPSIQLGDNGNGLRKHLAESLFSIDQ
jgi:hypothetical protein